MRPLSFTRPDLLTYDDSPRAKQVMKRQKFQEQNATEEEGHGQQLVTGKEADRPIRFG
jgi:hypothetical protein